MVEIDIYFHHAEMQEVVYFLYISMALLDWVPVS
jgi:hypothetical protein